MDGPAVVVRDLVVDRGGRRAVDGVSFTVHPGEVLGLLGPSGGGKSTLLRALVGVQLVRSGVVDVLGKPAGHPALRHSVAYQTQAASVYPDLSVRDNLRYFARVLGASPDDVDRVLRDVDLGDRSDDLVRELSGGQQARVSLATALLGSPQVLVLDEPTVGLDPVLRRDLWDLFARIADSGATLIVSSHVMDEASRCSRLLLIRDGALVADLTPQELLDRTGAPDHETAFLRLVESGEPR